MNWQKILFYLLPPLLALITFNFVHFKTDLSAFIIAGNNAEEIVLANEMQSGTLSRRYLISIESPAINSVKQKQDTKVFVKSLQLDLKEIEGVVDIWSPEQGQQSEIRQTMQSLYSRFSHNLYSTKNAASEDLSELFSSQGLIQRTELLKRLLLSPQASYIKKIALQDPLLLTLNNFQSIRGKFENKEYNNDNYHNLVLETAMAGLDAPEQSRIQSEIKSTFTPLNKASTKNYQLEMTGVPVFAATIQSQIQNDITKVSILSSIALSLLFLLIFRSFTSMFQVFSLLAIVIFTAMLMTQAIFGYVHGMTVAIGTTLVGICIDYPIHALAHAQSVKPSERTAIVAKIWPSMLLGGLTTLIGYVALGVSGYPGFQQVAVYAASGIITSLLFTRFILPRQITTQSSKQLNLPFITKWLAICEHFRPALLTLLIMGLAASLFGLKSLNWMEDMQELTPELDHLKLKDKQIRERMTSIEPGRFVLINGDNTESALQKAEQVYSILEQLKLEGGLSDYFGLYPWILSAHKQRLNQLQLQQYLTDENQLKWQQALKQQGLSVKKLGTLDYASPDTLSLEQVMDTPVKKLIDNQIIINEQQTLIIIWLAKHQPEVIKQALDKIEDATYFSQREMLNTMTKDYTERAKKLLLLGLGLIIIVLLIRYKNVLMTVLTLLPAVMAAFLIVSIWSFTGELISFLHLVGFLLVVAICVDYGIFYQENRAGNILLTYQAMSASMLTSAIAFGSLIIAESASLKILAVVVALGTIIGFVLCPLIIRKRHEESVN